MGIGGVVVGYRRGDPRRLSALAQGFESVPIKACYAGCGYEVYFVKSGVDAYMKRDPHVMCQDCYDRYKPQVQSEL